MGSKLMSSDKIAEFGPAEQNITKTSCFFFRSTSSPSAIDTVGRIGRKLAFITKQEADHCGHLLSLTISLEYLGLMLRGKCSM